MKKNFFEVAKRMVILMLTTAIATCSFTACHEDDDDEETTISKSYDYIHTSFMVSESLLEFSDLSITYKVNGEEIKEPVDISNATDATGKNDIPCKCLYVVKKISERPVTVTVLAEPKEDYAEILQAKLDNDIKKINIFTKGITGSAETATPYLDCKGIDNDLKYMQGMKVDSLIVKHKTFNITSATIKY